MLKRDHWSEVIIFEGVSWIEIKSLLSSENIEKMKKEREKNLKRKKNK